MTAWGPPVSGWRHVGKTEGGKLWKRDWQREQDPGALKFNPSSIAGDYQKKARRPLNSDQGFGLRTPFSWLLRESPPSF